MLKTALEINQHFVFFPTRENFHKISPKLIQWYLIMFFYELEKMTLAKHVKAKISYYKKKKKCLEFPKISTIYVLIFHHPEIA